MNYNDEDESAEERSFKLNDDIEDDFIDDIDEFDPGEEIEEDGDLLDKEEF